MSSAPDDRFYACLTLELPFALDSARLARVLTRELLLSNEVHLEVVDDIVLIVHELVTNGVLHGQPGPDSIVLVRCALHLAGIEVAVTDQGWTGHVAPRELNDFSARGRGLALVSALSETWAVDRTEGTCVSARVAV